MVKPFTPSDTPWQKKVRGRKSDRFDQQPSTHGASSSDRSPLRNIQPISPTRQVKTPHETEDKGIRRSRNSPQKGDDGAYKLAKEIEVVTIDDDKPKKKAPWKSNEGVRVDIKELTQMKLHSYFTSNPRKSGTASVNGTPEIKPSPSNSEPLRRSPRKSPKTVIEMLENTLSQPRIQAQPILEPAEPAIEQPPVEEAIQVLRRSPRKTQQMDSEEMNNEAMDLQEDFHEDVPEPRRSPRKQCVAEENEPMETDDTGNLQERASKRRRFPATFLTGHAKEGLSPPMKQKNAPTTKTSKSRNEDDSRHQQMVQVKAPTTTVRRSLRRAPAQTNDTADAPPKNPTVGELIDIPKFIDNATASGEALYQLLSRKKEARNDSSLITPEQLKEAMEKISEEMNRQKLEEQSTLSEDDTSTSGSSFNKESTVDTTSSREVSMRDTAKDIYSVEKVQDYLRDIIDTTEVTSIKQYLYSFLELEKKSLPPYKAEIHVFRSDDNKHDCLEAFQVARGNTIIHIKGKLIHRDISSGLEANPVKVFDSSGSRGNIAHEEYKYVLENDDSVVKPCASPELFQLSCDCTDGCGLSCKCAHASVKYGQTFMVQKRYLITNELTDCWSSACFACGPACGCKGNCSNAAPESATNPHLELFRHDKRMGMGVRTTKAMLPGEILFEFTGVLKYENEGDVNKDYAWKLYDPVDELDQLGYQNILAGVYGYEPNQSKVDEEKKKEYKKAAKKNKRRKKGSKHSKADQESDTSDGTSSTFSIPEKNPRTYPKGGYWDPVVEDKRNKKQAELKAKEKEKEQKEAEPVESTSDNNEEEADDEYEDEEQEEEQVAQTANTQIRSRKPKRDPLPQMGDKRIYIDPFKKGNIGRFVSHAEFPNATPVRVFQNDLRIEKGRLVFICARAIPAGAEVFVDYGSDYKGFVRCLCGSIACVDAQEILRTSGEHKAYWILYYHLKECRKRMEETLEKITVTDEEARDLIMKCTALNTHERYSNDPSFPTLIRYHNRIGTKDTGNVDLETDTDAYESELEREQQRIDEDNVATDDESIADD